MRVRVRMRVRMRVRELRELIDARIGRPGGGRAGASKSSQGGADEDEDGAGDEDERPMATAAGAAASHPGLEGPGWAWPKRNGTRAAGGPRGRRPAKLIKVYTWFAHWCAGSRKSFIKVHLSVCKR